MNKRLLSVILSLLLVLSLLPLEAFANDENPTPVKVKLHGKNIRDYKDKGSKTIAAYDDSGPYYPSLAARTEILQNAYDTVYLGGDPYYVLSMSGSSDNYTYNETDNPNGIHTIATYQDDMGKSVDASNAMFLLSDASLGTSAFGAKDKTHFWSKQTTGSLWDNLNGSGNASTLAKKMGLSDVEYAAILNTTKSDVQIVTAASDGYNGNCSYTFNQTWSDTSTDPATTRFSGDLRGDKLYLLSASEIANPAYGLNTRQAMRTYGAVDIWWLRSSYSDSQVGYINADGGFMVGVADAVNPYVRPALNLNLNSVLFASDAVEGGKSNSNVGTFTNAIATTDTNQWKLTLIDSDKKLNSATLRRNGTNYWVVYSGASTGNRTYLSAIIVNKESGEILSYGKLKALTDNSDSSGTTASFQMPDGVSLGGNTVMQVFVETVADGQKGTDYASAVKEFNSAETVESITVTGANTNYIAGDTFEKEGITVTAHLSGGGTLKLNNWTFDYPNYRVSEKNDGKFHVDTKERETQTVKINSGYVNAEGKPVTYNLIVNVDGIGKTDKPTLELSENDDGSYKITVSNMLDGVVTEYSTDGGRTWRNVGTKLDSISSRLSEVTYQVRIKSDIANDRAAGTAESVTVPAREATIYDAVFSAAVLSAVTTGIFAIEANRLITKGFVINNSILGNKVSSWVKMMYKLSGLKLGS